MQRSWAEDDDSARRWRGAGGEGGAWCAGRGPRTAHTAPRHLPTLPALSLPRLPELTFIVLWDWEGEAGGACDKAGQGRACGEARPGAAGAAPGLPDPPVTSPPPLPPAVGDVNLFFNSPAGGTAEAEVEVMVAERAARGHGVGPAAVAMAIAYAHAKLVRCRSMGEWATPPWCSGPDRRPCSHPSCLTLATLPAHPSPPPTSLLPSQGTTRFIAKIGRANAASAAAFARLGFEACGGSDVFREDHCCLDTATPAGAALLARVGGLAVASYDRAVAGG